MNNPFSWDYLTTVAPSDDVIGTFSIIYAAIFALGFVAAGYLYYRPRTPFFSRYFRKKVIQRASVVAMWVFGLGLFFFLVRIFQINPFGFGQRLWINGLGVIAICMAAVFVVGIALAVRRGPIPKTPTGWTKSGFHAAPRRRPTQRPRRGV